GLGADERVFEKLELPNMMNQVFLNWVMPLDNDNLASYSKRLAEKINEREPFALVGLSMGGMVAIEIAKIKKPVKLVIISSVPTFHSFPKRIKAAGFLHLYN